MPSKPPSSLGGSSGSSIFVDLSGKKLLYGVVGFGAFAMLVGLTGHLLSTLSSDDPWTHNPPEPKLVCTATADVKARVGAATDHVCVTQVYGCPLPFQLDPYTDLNYSARPTRYRCRLDAEPSTPPN